MKKKLIYIASLVLMLVAASCCSVNAQTPNKVGELESYMTPAQIAKYQSDLNVAQLEKKLRVYGDWVGVGGEVGSAVEEALSAVVDVAGKFGTTDVGKFTMGLVLWKVAGEDIIRIVLGLLFLSSLSVVLLYSFRTTCITRRILTEHTNEGLWKYPKKKEYETIDPKFDGNGLAMIRIGHILLYMIGIWITYGIMFTS